jgi:hypothetical protein
VFKLATSNPWLLRFVYSSRGLDRFVTFRLSAIDEIRDEYLLDQIYARAATPGGHAKQSSRGRFADADKVAVRLVAPMSSRVVHDVAVSSGITSCELFDALSKLENLEFYVSDRYNRLRCEGELFQRIYSREGEMICGYLGPLAAEEKPSRFVYGSAVLHRMLSWWPRRGHGREIDLFHPTTRMYLREGRLREIDYDVFAAKIVGRFTFVRCMNILNLNSWFSESAIRKGLANVIESVAVGGVLQLGRTRVDGTNDVTFYERAATGLNAVERMNSGSELEPLVSDARSGFFR